MTMRYSVCILVLFAASSISISESISSEHSRRETGGDSQKRDCVDGGGKHDCHVTGCNQHSDCHHCSDHTRPFCFQGRCHCTECKNHTDCSHHCNALQSFYCSLGSCHCGATTSTEAATTTSFKNTTMTTPATSPITTTQHTRKTTNLLTTPDIFSLWLECLNHTECSQHCNAHQPFYCSLGSCHCGDIVCHQISDCNHHCRASEKSMCFNGRCSCIETTTTTSTPTTTTTEAPTTTPDPTTVDPLLIKCTTHTECSSHVCPAGKHPYCSFGQRSTDCQCTVCTDNSHCFCPAGLAGKCHFNYFDRSYSCVCGLAPETTTVSQTTAQHGASTTQQTTLALGIRSCHICGDNDNGIPCDTRSIYTGNLQQCGPGEDFCMTDLIHNGQPFPTIFKRCVTEKECHNKWLVQTSDLEFCTNYGNVPVEGPFNCHFCCTSDGCNSNQIPEKSTLYIFTTTSTEAATTTSFKNTAVTTPASSPPTTTLHTTKPTNLLTTPATTTAVLTTKTTTTTTTYQTSGKPCPFCDTDLNCVWNQTCSDSETCMVRGVFKQGFKFSVHCIMSSDCQLMALMATKFGEIFCCDDRGCLERYLPGG